MKKYLRVLRSFNVVGLSSLFVFALAFTIFLGGDLKKAEAWLIQFDDGSCLTIGYITYYEKCPTGLPDPGTGDNIGTVTASLKNLDSKTALNFKDTLEEGAFLLKLANENKKITSTTTLTVRDKRTREPVVAGTKCTVDYSSLLNEVVYVGFNGLLTLTNVPPDITQVMLNCPPYVAGTFKLLTLVTDNVQRYEKQQLVNEYTTTCDAITSIGANCNNLGCMFPEDSGVIAQSQHRFRDLWSLATKGIVGVKQMSFTANDKLLRQDADMSSREEIPMQYLEFSKAFGTDKQMTAAHQNAAAAHRNAMLNVWMRFHEDRADKMNENMKNEWYNLYNQMQEKAMYDYTYDSYRASLWSFTTQIDGFYQTYFDQMSPGMQQAWASAQQHRADEYLILAKAINATVGTVSYRDACQEGMCEYPWRDAVRNGVYEDTLCAIGDKTCSTTSASIVAPKNAVRFAITVGIGGSNSVILKDKVLKVSSNITAVSPFSSTGTSTITNQGFKIDDGTFGKFKLAYTVKGQSNSKILKFDLLSTASSVGITNKPVFKLQNLVPPNAKIVPNSLYKISPLPSGQGFYQINDKTGSFEIEIPVSNSAN